MGIAVLIGCVLLAFSIPFAVLVFVVKGSAKLVIIFFTGAFVWLLAALSSSIIWAILIPIKYTAWWFVLCYAVALQEYFRFLLWKLLKKAEDGLGTLTPDGDVVITREKQSLIAGLGFGAMSGVMQFNLVLSASGGPGTLDTRGGTGVSLFVVSSLIVAMLVVLNSLWSVIMYRGLELKAAGTSTGFNALTKGYMPLLSVVAGHLFASLLTLNDQQRGNVAGTLVPIFLLTVVTGYQAWTMVGLRFKIE